jgi:hypothetical protein
MSSSPHRKPRRQRKGNTDYTLDDLVNLTGIEHTFSFLNPKLLTINSLPAETVPDVLELGTAPRSTTVPISTTVPETTTVPRYTSVPVSGTVPISTQPRTRVFRATRVEHGHTLGEHLIYEVLWRNAYSDEGSSSRVITLGYDRLASLASVNWKTARMCLRGLEIKLAIESIADYNSDQRTGRTYRVYSFTEILERRRQAGMCWVEKGRGVKFLQTGTVPVFTSVPEPGAVPESGTEGESGTETVPETGAGTVPETGTPLESKKEEERKEASSSELSWFQQRAGQLIGLDDDAARAIIRRCREHDREATADEIWHFCEQKILERARNKEPVGPGLLIVAVPKYFAPPANELQRYRRQRQLRHV